VILLRALIAALVVLLAGCETEGGMLFTYAAQGTRIQAERVVALVYGLPGKPLAYGGGDIEKPLARMRTRWPQLKAELEAGRLGLTETGGVAVRASNPDAALKKLVREENRDRDFLYRGISEAVGHRDLSLPAWMDYTEDVFAKEWVKQAPAGWWYQDQSLLWQRKQ